MRIPFRLLGAWAVAMSLAGCLVGDIVFDDDDVWHDDNIHGSGRLVSETRPVSNFDGVTASGVGTVIIEQRGYESLRITAEDNILPYLDSRVTGGMLILGPRPNPGLSPTREILYEVTVRSLQDVLGSGVVEFELEDLDTGFLATSLSGASTLDGYGYADEQDVVISGAARYRGEDLAGQVVFIDASGATFAVVNASEHLDATVSGTATIEYVGNPVVVAHVSGLGTIRPH